MLYVCKSLTYPSTQNKLVNKISTIIINFPDGNYHGKNVIRKWVITANSTEGGQNKLWVWARQVYQNRKENENFLPRKII